ncbi:hypothetical protein COU36_05040 [Candidatus Micrarchaeota archaeon CG10_big_fil_rev_8_21_14_0_10_59_7]|nr:MAG: hypothetical protein COU36_05040 [Candidatus Micrarchaeota archaeon CG10_big_fil_rev_8_21_14_0_10_59_7]
MGIDSGATTAYAALDLDGNILAMESRKNWNKGDFLRRLGRWTPLVVASDTNPPLKFAKKVAATFKARLFAPPRSLTHREKCRITRDFNYGNTHERDALASAIKAYNSIAANKMRQVKRRFGTREAQERVMRGERMASLCRGVLRV